MAAFTGDTPPDVYRLQERLKDELRYILNKFSGKKDLVLDASLMKPLDRIAGPAFLKENGVDKIFKLDRFDKNTAFGDCQQRIYIVKPRINVMKILADQISNEKAKGHNRKYRIVMVPRKLYLCEMILEQEGVYGLCELDEFNLNLVPLDTDVLSMEMPEFFKMLYLDNDLTYLHTVCSSIMNIQNLMKEIPNVYCIGRAGKMCHELLKELSGGDKLIEPDYPRSEIGHLVLFDREVDLVTPLCSQVTYQGLLDDIFSINCGYMEFGPEITQKSQGVKLILSGADERSLGLASDQLVHLLDTYFKLRIKDNSSNRQLPYIHDYKMLTNMFFEIRDRHFSNVFDFLKHKAQHLQTVSDKRKDFSSVSDMKEFVAKDLRALNQSKATLSYHIGACEQIINKKNKGDFQEYVQTEHCLLEGSGFRENLLYIEDSINRQDSVVSNLKLLCLMSLTNDGIPPRDYKSLKTQLVQSHGFEHMVTFHNLDKAGLLKEHKDSGAQSKVAAGVAALTKSSVFKNLRKRLNLIPSGDVDIKNPCDMSYVFSGAYTPLSCKLVEMVLQKEGFTGLEDVTKHLAGGVYSEVRLPTPGKGSKPTNKPGRAKKVVLVYFIGGCSYTEISALRFLGKQTGYRFIIATTAIITGNTLLDGIIEKPQT